MCEFGHQESKRLTAERMERAPAEPSRVTADFWLPKLVLAFLHPR